MSVERLVQRSIRADSSKVIQQLNDFDVEFLEPVAQHPIGQCEVERIGADGKCLDLHYSGLKRFVDLHFIGNQHDRHTHTVRIAYIFYLLQVSSCFGKLPLKQLAFLLENLASANLQ